MPRVKRGLAANKKKKKLFKLSSGYIGGRRNLNRTAQEAVDKGLNHAFRDRRARKREFRALWINRINVAARINDISYSKLIGGLNKAGVKVNRKVMADLAINDPTAFAELVHIANTNTN